MKRINYLILFLLVVFSISPATAQQKSSFADYVNPYIGVLDDESYCTIGPQLPFGSVNPCPQTLEGGNDGYSFYESIRGFAQLHVSGTGWGKYGQFLVSPQTGLDIREGQHDSPKSGEIAKAYYYAVTLNRYQIKTEFTPTSHSVIYRFTFPQSNESHIIIDVTHSLTRDIAPYIGGNVSAGNIEIDTTDKNRITGFGRYSGGFGGEGEYNVYFCARFSKTPASSGTWQNGKKQTKPFASISNNNERIGAFLKFHTADQEPVYMKIGISFKSVKQAEAWLESEIPSWDFETVKENAKKTWDRELGKIEVDGGSEKDKTLFYSALYRSMMMPRDRTNDFKGWDEKASLWDDHYAVWDTWRTAFPLMSLINPGMVRDNVNAFIERFKKNHIVKDAFIAGEDMFREQGGNNIDNVIADAYVKGIQGIDWEKAYEVLKYDADNQRLGLQWSNIPEKQDTVMASYKKRGWIPAGIMSCSIGLEYQYNDFCVAQVAKGLGKDADYKKYLKRSQQWTELWNQNLESGGYKGFIGPRKPNGDWINIDPARNWGSWHEYFYEASSWTYSYFVPQDFPKLVELSGGADVFAQKLEYGLEHHLIDYSNEPAFLAIQSFHYAHRSDLASYWVKKMMSEQYTDKGYPGNEDSGAMGSWYVFAALGFFPNAGQPLYYLNGPVFKKIILSLGNGKKLLITATNASGENVYVQNCFLNGKKLTEPYITHSQLMEGGSLEFTMGNSQVH
jgi:predicted alpha-1,2-mannosidase